MPANGLISLTNLNAEIGTRLAAIGRVALVLCAVLSASACPAAPREIPAEDQASPLRLVRQIALPKTSGRIDHLAVDLSHHLLFVAEYENGTVDAVDLNASRVAGRIEGLHAPQGIAVVPDGKQVVVACGDGTVHFYATADRHEIARLLLGEDADNVRIDPRNDHVVVGYGDGALAVIDPDTHQVLSQMRLPGHPEGFRLLGGQVFVNVPDRGVILAGDLDAGRITSSWKTGIHRFNFPLAIDPTGRWFAIAYRFPAALQLRNTGDGKVRATSKTCGDADDLFIDGDRLYVVCGAGYVEVISASHPDADTMRISTSRGARTGLFVPELKTLFVAVPARGSGTAAIRVLHTG